MRYKHLSNDLSLPCWFVDFSWRLLIAFHITVIITFMSKDLLSALVAINLVTSSQGLLLWLVLASFLSTSYAKK